MKRWAALARLGGIGDNLVAASPLRVLKRLGYMTEMVTSYTASVVFLNNPFLDKLSVKKEGEIPGGPEWQKWFAARAGEYDLLVNLSNTMETRHAKHMGDTAFWWPQDYRREVCAGSYLETAHKVVGVPYEPDDFGPLFFPTEEEKETALKPREGGKSPIEGPYMVWVLAGSRVDKVYPYAAHAISRIISELRIPVVMTGIGPAQYLFAKSIMEDVGRSNSGLKHLHLALSPDGAEAGGHQHWSVRRTLTVACLADLVVTPDTGVGWAVALEQMPKIALMSHASAENITKHWKNTVTLQADPFRIPCHPCHRLHDDMSTCVPAKDNPNTAACMADIKVQDILDNIDRLWRKRSNVVQLEAAE